MQSEGHEVLIVSSGSIAIGSSLLGINKKRARLEDLQAAKSAALYMPVGAVGSLFLAVEAQAGSAAGKNGVFGVFDRMKAWFQGNF